MYPKERDSWRGVDIGLRPVACCTGDGTANCETEDDGCGFHERGTELLDDDYGDKDGETEANELWVAPGIVHQYINLLWKETDELGKHAREGAWEHRC